jgi:hypothetical protein
MRPFECTDTRIVQDQNAIAGGKARLDFRLYQIDGRPLFITSFTSLAARGNTLKKLMTRSASCLHRRATAAAILNYPTIIYVYIRLKSVDGKLKDSYGRVTTSFGPEGRVKGMPAW